MATRPPWGSLLFATDKNFGNHVAMFNQMAELTRGQPLAIHYVDSDTDGLRETRLYEDALTAVTQTVEEFMGVSTAHTLVLPDIFQNWLAKANPDPRIILTRVEHFMKFAKLRFVVEFSGYTAQQDPIADQNQEATLPPQVDGASESPMREPSAAPPPTVAPQYQSWFRPCQLPEARTTYEFQWEQLMQEKTANRPYLLQLRCPVEPSRVKWQIRYDTAWDLVQNFLCFAQAVHPDFHTQVVTAYRRWLFNGAPREDPQVFINMIRGLYHIWMTVPDFAEPEEKKPDWELEDALVNAEKQCKEQLQLEAKGESVYFPAGSWDPKSLPSLEFCEDLCRARLRAQAEAQTNGLWLMFPNQFHYCFAYPPTDGGLTVRVVPDMPLLKEPSKAVILSLPRDPEAVRFFQAPDLTAPALPDVTQQIPNPEDYAEYLVTPAHIAMFRQFNPFEGLTDAQVADQVVFLRLQLLGPLMMQYFQ